MSASSLCTPPGGHVSATSAAQLDIVVRELGHLVERLCVSANHSRALGSATEWHAKAAEAFHLLADEWSQDLAQVVRLAWQAQADAQAARDGVVAAMGWCP